MTQVTNQPAAIPRDLILEDESRYRGFGFGGDAMVGGEVVFATGMVGFVESLTDPSYRGQILVLTYPLQGNYGVPADRNDAFESQRVQPQALIVGTAARFPSHHESTRSLGTWLSGARVPGIEGVDTRALTQRLRERGTMRGWVLPAGLQGRDLDEAKSRALTLDEASIAQAVTSTVPRLEGSGKRLVMLVDSGAKRNIARELLRRELSVLTVPFHADLEALAETHRVDGLVLGNGPGDPKALAGYVTQVRRLLAGSLPTFGVCLGHQILALAAGGDTYKLPYGHRSQNQPVRDTLTNRSYVTSQNHGYAVRAETLPNDFLPWFVNLNDGTNEGLRHRTRFVRSVQFHPEAAPGPEDTRFLFDDLARELGTRAPRGVSR